MTIAPFPAWTPDAPDYANGMVEASGVYPRTESSYGPVGSLVAYTTTPLSARCQGAISARQNSGGAVYGFAGDASKLYVLSGVAWSNISKSGGYTVSSDESWEFVQFGDRVIAASIGNATQACNMASSFAFADLSSTAPQGRHIAVIRDFVVIGNTYDATNRYQPQRVWWSAVNDCTNWPAVGSTAAANVQSDWQDLPNGGWVQAIVGSIGGTDGAIFLDTSVYRMSYVGPPYIFQFDEVERARGTPAPGSVANTGNFVAYLTDDGFYVFDGTASKPIGASVVDKWFFGQLDQSYYSRITSAVDPINKLIVWSFPSIGAGGSPDTWLIWNWQLNRWSTCKITCERLFRARSVGVTLDGLDGLFPSGLDSIPFSLDSRAFTGGRLILGAFDASHNLAFPTGSSLAATLTTGEMAGSNGQRIIVLGIRPVVDGGTVTASVGYRDAPSGTVTYTAPTSPEVTGICPQRIDARYARAKVQIAAGGTWSHAYGVEPTIAKAGLR